MSGAVQIQNRKSKIQNGFTLTEILIVIALIVLVIALAVPAFSFITGSRSVDAGENLVAAMLGRARAEAVRNHHVAGVAFYRDINQDRSAMALVVPAADANSVAPEPAGLEQYKAWRPKQEDGSAVQYKKGDIVIRLVLNDNSGVRKKVTTLFVCRQDHAANAGNGPPDQTPPPTSNANWGPLDNTDIDVLEGVDVQYLPTGVGAQLINDPDPDPKTPAPTTGRDRYVRTGMILFDGTGQVIHQPYVIRQGANLHRLIFGENNTHPAVGIGATSPIYSQLGLVLYDNEVFKTSAGGDDDPIVEGTAYTANGGAEANEESWLDNNALSLMVNRYNGTLIRGE